MNRSDTETARCTCDAQIVPGANHVPPCALYDAEEDARIQREGRGRLIGKLTKLELEHARVVAEREKLAWVIRELHEGACSPAYRPPDSDYRLWALEVIEREATDVFPQPAKADPPPASSESSHGSEDTDG